MHVVKRAVPAVMLLLPALVGLRALASCAGDDSAPNDVGGTDASGMDAGTTDSATDSGAPDSSATACTDPSLEGGSGVPLAPGDDLTKAVSSNPPGTRFLLACGTYRFPTDNSARTPLLPLAGDQFIGAGTVCGIPTSTPCAHLSGAIRIPTDSPDKTWHQMGSLWYNTVGATNAATVPPVADNTAKCFIRNGAGAVTDTNAYGACVYGQDLFFNSLPKARLSTPDNGGVEQFPPTPGFWYFDIAGAHGAANTVWIADDPSSSAIELSVVDGAFRTFDPAELNPNVVIQNLTIEQFAGVYGTGAIWAFGDHWQILNNWVQHNHYDGVSANGSIGVRPHDWLVQYNELYENGNGGAGGPTIDSTWSYNQFDRNGYANYGNDSGQKWVGTNPIIANNTVNHTNGVGLWFDSFTQNGVFSQNAVFAGDAEGIRCEISHGCSITSNTVTQNEQFSNDLCVSAHVPWPLGNDCCTGPQTGTCSTACVAGSLGPDEITVAQSDSSMVGGADGGNIVTTNCGGIAVTTGTRETDGGDGGEIPNTGNSVTYNLIFYTGSAATVPHPYGIHVGPGGVVPAPNTFDYNAYHFVAAGAAALDAGNWQNPADAFVTFAQWQAIPQDPHATATSP